MSRRDYQPGQGPMRGLVVAFAFTAIILGAVVGILWVTS